MVALADTSHRITPGSDFLRDDLLPYGSSQRLGAAKEAHACLMAVEQRNGLVDNYLTERRWRLEMAVHETILLSLTSVVNPQLISVRTLEL